MIRKDIPHWMKMCPECLGDGDDGDGDCPACKGAGIIEKGYMNPIDQAWAIIKQSDELNKTTTEWHWDDSRQRMIQTTHCELCSKKIPLDEVGGFTDSGPHCKECDNNLCEHCNGDGYHGDEMCEECQGSGLASGPPKKEDYMPSDGEGYEGALNEWKDKYGNQ